MCHLVDHSPRKDTVWLVWLEVQCDARSGSNVQSEARIAHILAEVRYVLYVSQMHHMPVSSKMQQGHQGFVSQKAFTWRQETVGHLAHCFFSKWGLGCAMTLWISMVVEDAKISGFATGSFHFGAQDIMSTGLQIPNPVRLSKRDKHINDTNWEQHHQSICQNVQNAAIDTFSMSHQWSSGLIADSMLIGWIQVSKYIRIKIINCDCGQACRNGAPLCCITSIWAAGVTYKSSMNSHCKNDRFLLLDTLNSFTLVSEQRHP